MKSKVIEIYGEKFLANLEWYILEKKKVRSFIREQKKKKRNEVSSGKQGSGEELFVKFCKKGLCNVGIIHGLSEKEAKEYPLLAPTLAKAIKEVPFAGIFHLNDNLAYCIAIDENNLIFPKGERLGKVEEVKETYLSTLELLDNWKKLVSEGTLEDLYNILLSTEKRYYYKPFPISKVVAGIVTTSLIVSTGVLGWNTYKRRAYQRSIRKARAKLNFNVVKKYQKPITKKLSKEVPEFHIRAYPPSLIECCLSKYEFLKHKLAGWSINNFVCGNATDAVLTRKAGFPILYVGKGINMSGLENAELKQGNPLKPIQVIPGVNKKVETSLKQWSIIWSTETSIRYQNSVSYGDKSIKVHARVFSVQGEGIPMLLSLGALPGIAFREITLNPPNWAVQGYIIKGQHN